MLPLLPWLPLWLLLWLPLVTIAPEAAAGAAANGATLLPLPPAIAAPKAVEAASDAALLLLLLPPPVLVAAEVWPVISLCDAMHSTTCGAGTKGCSMASASTPQGMRKRTREARHSGRNELCTRAQQQTARARCWHAHARADRARTFEHFACCLQATKLDLRVLRHAAEDGLSDRCLGWNGQCQGFTAAGAHLG